MKILVCGGRDFNDKRLLYRTMFELEDKYGTDFVIIQGAAKGADSLALEFAIDFDHPYESYPAAWRVLGSRAGPIRNQQMLTEGKPDLVVAFKGGIGTQDMISKAEKAGIEVIKVNC